MEKDSGMTIEERVELGSRYFDEHFEDWLDLFNKDEPELDLASCNLHITAIVTGIDFNLGFRQYYDTGQEQWLFDCGFDGTDDEIDTLNEEWKLLIIKRKMIYLYSQGELNL